MSSASKVIENIIEFIEVKTEQIKLKVISRVARLLSGVFALSFIAVLMLFFLFFLSYAFAIMINLKLESEFLGYLIIAGVYLFLIILLFFLLKSRKLQRWIEALIIKLEEAKYEHEKKH